MPPAADPTADPTTVVRTFLDAVSAKHTETAIALMHDDIEWRNTGLPTLRGRRRVGGTFRASEARGVAVEIRVHSLAADGDVVLTDRTDVIGLGPVATAFWVRGTFEVSGGLIRVWDDRYSPVDVLAGAARGVAGALRDVVRR